MLLFVKSGRCFGDGFSYLDVGNGFPTQCSDLSFKSGTVFPSLQKCCGRAFAQTRVQSLSDVSANFC